jgi:hypothetical protein
MKYTVQEICYFFKYMVQEYLVIYNPFLMKNSGMCKMLVPGLVAVAMLVLLLNNLEVDLGSVSTFVDKWWPATLLLAYGKKLMGGSCCK